MASSLRHRGPDSDGYLIDGGLGLTMRRLKVIDLVTGDQPMTTSDGRLSIVFNGEIYNYLELRRELEQRGRRFATRSDTEVLLQVFAEFGVVGLQRLNGMYACAIWDAHAGELILARDPVGIKPLYYWMNDDRLLFASEVSALFASGVVPRRIDERLVPALFLHQYIPHPRTMYEDVAKLSPGCVLRASRSGVTVERFSKPIEAASGQWCDIEQAAEAIRQRLRRAVGYRLIADVPLGAFCSGGLDSSIIVGLMAEQSTRAVTTFSVGFDTARPFDELEHARRVAAHFATDHHELVLSSEELVARLPEVLDRLDEPIIDPALLPTLLLSAMARETVTVVLTGEGADELFGGYRRYRLQHGLGWLGPLAGMGAMVARPHRWKQALTALSTTSALDNHLAWSQTMGDNVAARLFEPSLLELSRSYVRQQMAEHAGTGKDRVATALQLDQAFWLVDDLLTKVDKMSMAYSLEARVPYLDQQVIELARGLPTSWKTRRLTGKWILRKAFAHLLPEGITSRGKQGFDLPLREWFRDDLRSWVQDNIATLKDDPVLDFAAVKRLTNDHMAGKDDFALLLFSLVAYSRLRAAGAP